MRARWVHHYPSPKSPVLGQALVASFLPGKYYLVSTIQLDSSSPLSRLTRSIDKGIAYQDVAPEPDGFVTGVFRCDKMGWAKSLDNPLYEREYSDLSQAECGHREIVELLAKGQLKLASQRPRSNR